MVHRSHPGWRKKLARLLGYDVDYRPALRSGEYIIAESTAADRKGLVGGNWGPLFLTNDRIIWRKAGMWPFKRSSLDLRLADIKAVGKTTLLSAVFGGRRLQLRMRVGRDHRLWVDGLDEWMAAMRTAIADLPRT